MNREEFWILGELAISKLFIAKVLSLQHVATNDIKWCGRKENSDFFLCASPDDWAELTMSVAALLVGLGFNHNGHFHQMILNFMKMIWMSRRYLIHPWAENS